jgi:hypothetical protein
MNEQAKLFEWLIQNFNDVIQSQDSHSAESEASNELQENIFAYLKCDMESIAKISDCWIKKTTKPSNPTLQVMVNEEMAITTKVAMNALVAYYKSTNLAKWNSFFYKDSYYVNLFAFLKQHEQSQKLNRFYENYLIEWATFEVFPWEELTAYLEDPKDQRIKKFCSKIWMFDWSSTEKYFRY